MAKNVGVSGIAVLSNEQSMFDLVKKVEQSSLEEPKPFYFIDSCSAITDLVDSLVDLHANPPSLYIDLEGVNLGRHGSISVLQLLIFPQNRIYLIDVHTLGSQTFSTAGTNGQTLRMILESNTIPKVFFDVRNDSDALYSHFGICLSGVQDIQVMEFATRRSKGRFVNGLAKCIDYDLVMTAAEKYTWLSVKEKGKKLFAPECGGSYELFNVRPMSKDLSLYCAQDVQYLPRLWSIYNSKLSLSELARVRMTSDERVRSSHSATYNGHGKHKALGPW